MSRIYDLRCPHCLSDYGAMRCTALDMQDIFQCMNCGLMFIKEGIPMAELQATGRPTMNGARLTFDHCARCDQPHSNLVFWRFTRPVVDADGTVWALWAECPNTREPILAREGSPILEARQNATDSDS